ARRVGCPWCADFGATLHRPDARPIDRLTASYNYATSPKFRDDGRAAIAFANEMIAAPHSVTDAPAADRRARFAESGGLAL
ncbi:hypothetical protein J8J19_23370, partial [Mycobacterium tuberculosis]|nr:hypothetical protein [Mycobacterium tuberculosis]